MWSLGCILGETVNGRPIFPGTSTMNQLERIMELTGRPTMADVEAMKSPFAATMLESLNIKRPRTFSEMFPSAHPDALDLLRRLLEFNPERRISAEEALKHPFVAPFHNAQDEPTCPYTIVPPLSDNTKLTVENYRSILYEEIQRAKRREVRRNSRQSAQHNNTSNAQSSNTRAAVSSSTAANNNPPQRTSSYHNNRSSSMHHMQQQQQQAAAVQQQSAQMHHQMIQQQQHSSSSAAAAAAVNHPSVVQHQSAARQPPRSRVPPPGDEPIGGQQPQQPCYNNPTAMMGRESRTSSGTRYMDAASFGRGSRQRDSRGIDVLSSHVAGGAAPNYPAFAVGPKSTTSAVEGRPAGRAASSQTKFRKPSESSMYPVIQRQGSNTSFHGQRFSAGPVQR